MYVKVNEDNEIEYYDIENDCCINDNDDSNFYTIFRLNKKDYDFNSNSEAEFERFYKDCVKNKDYKIK